MLNKKTKAGLALALSLLLHVAAMGLLPMMQPEKIRPPLQLGLLALAPSAPQAAQGTPQALPSAASLAHKMPPRAPPASKKAARVQAPPASPPPAADTVPLKDMPAIQAKDGASTSAGSAATAKPAASATGSSSAGAAGEGAGAGNSAANWRAGYLANSKPDYPERSRARGEQGRVVLRVEVGADGRVRTLFILASSGFPRLDRAARDAVERWRFEPARRAGQAVADTVDIPLRFDLQAE